MPKDTKFPKPKQSFSALMQQRHLRATKSLGYVLADGSPDAWAALAGILEIRLNPAERGALAYASACRLELDDLEMTYEHLRETRFKKWARA